MLFVTALLFSGVKKYLPSFALRKSCKELFKGAMAACITAIGAFALKSILSASLMVTFLIIGFFVVSIYAILLFLFKSDNIEWIWKGMCRKIKGE